jgi:hypothetical protein
LKILYNQRIQKGNIETPKMFKLNNGNIYIIIIIWNRRIEIEYKNIQSIIMHYNY